MRSHTFSRMLARAWGVVFALAVLSTAGAAQQLTTGSIRGMVMSDGRAVDLAEVTARNEETGVTFRTATGAAGRFEFVALPVGPYAVTVRRIGYRPEERRGIVVHLGEVVQLSFALQTAAAQLEALTVTAETQPLVDTERSGYVDLVNERQIEAIPVNGRNFADLVALSPSVQLGVGDGSGGNLSLGGGRRGANLIQIDGAGATGTFFGGEARGSDRIPFAFSIETVREFQVVTNAFDVEFGNFSGGVINAVTKSGTNRLRGSLFGFFRGDEMLGVKTTGNDFFNNPPTEFTSRQVGGTLSGPIVQDKVHFFLAVERQDRDEPIFGLPAPGTTPDPSTNVHPDSVQRFLDILQNTYGITETAGRFAQTQDEWSVFGRIDWQLSDRHRLTIRHNYTDLDQQNDRISSNELGGNGGIFSNTGNSTVLSLTSTLATNITNDFRAQLAFEPRPREAYSLVPQGRVTITSDFPDGSQGRVNAECCNDPVLPNNLEETTIELANNVYIRQGDHAFKIGARANLFSYLNFFFFNQQGEFRFNNLAAFEAGNASRFTRALPNPGPDGQFFTADDVLPLAEYSVHEFSFYAQDSWDVTNRLNLTLGARADLTRFPDAAPLNQALANSPLGVRTDEAPSQTYVSPRLGFTYQLDNDRRTVLRGGAGLFYGRFPAVLYSNSLLNTGENQLSLFCSGAAVPTPDYTAYAQDPSTIPTACAGGGAASPPVPNINAFDPSFEYPRSLKANLGIERGLSDRFKVGLDVLYSTTADNFYVEDRNLLGEQFRSAVENRPVFAPAAGIGSSGSVSGSANRVDPAFADVLVHVSTAESRTWQVILSTEARLSPTTTLQASYAWQRSRDNSSYSCCISSTALFETPTAGNPNFLGNPGDELNGTWGPAEFERQHTFVLSGFSRLPLGIELSGILRAASGRPWTPIIDGDANGDGRFGNDRAFIGNTLSFDDPAVDGPLIDSLIGAHACLAKQAGRIASRNSCRNGWTTLLDLRVRRAFRTVGSQEFELIADFFNVLNLLNDDWGRNIGVTGSNTELLAVEGFDPVSNTYTYSVNPSFGTESDLTPFRTDQFQMQVGVRYRF